MSALVLFAIAFIAGHALASKVWRRAPQIELPPASTPSDPEERERHYRMHREEQIAELAQYGNATALARGYIHVPLSSCCQRGECDRSDDDPRMPVAPGRKL